VDVDFNEAIELAGKSIDAAGVAVLVVGAVVAAARAAQSTRTRQPDVYRRFRRQLGRSILLGLELLVAADIIRTVAVTPTLDSVLVLALIVAIRTFLSFSLELEITGRWPWQKTVETPDTDQPEGSKAAS
jgi:uncharacterized membrane protein